MVCKRARARVKVLKSLPLLVNLLYARSQNLRTEIYVLHSASRMTGDSPYNDSYVLIRRSAAAIFSS